MLSFFRRSDFDLALEAMRRDHADSYRNWVRVGILVCLLGYTASCVSLTLMRSWSVAIESGDVFVVLANLIALAILGCGYPRAAASLTLLAAFVDVHWSLLAWRMPMLGNIGLVVPVFVLVTGLLFGGHRATLAALVFSLSVPATLWYASIRDPGAGLRDRAVVQFVVVLEVVVFATTAIVLALLRSFAEILEQHQASQARSRALQVQLQHAQKLEALGLLAGGVAHDFNNLLAAIGAYGSLLERSSDPRAREYGAEIVAAQKRGARLTRQLLAFARKDTVQPRPMDLARTLAGMTALLKQAVGGKVQLHIEAQPGCSIVADPGRIEQVVLNLVMNARDAMPSGGRLWIRCALEGEQVRFEVEDEGVGMDEKVQARIFEPFFTTKSAQRGTGLGLSTVHGIVADSSGSIEVQSHVDRGTRFIVRWPRAALEPEPALAPTVEIEGAERLVWLIEDNDGARTYIERLLRDHGFRVESACSAEQALAHVATATEPPALVVSDVILPGLTGPELVAKLRARWNALHCLFLSGYLGDVALGEGFNPSADLLLKPFTSNELLARIASKLTSPGTSEQTVSVSDGEPTHAQVARSLA